MKTNNKGFTLVEVIVGFTLLVILVVSFEKIIKLSTNLTNSAIDLKRMTIDFYDRYYSGTNYYADNGKPAFRKSKNSENTVKLNIVIKEYSSEDNIEDASPIKEFALSNVKIKIIENLYDKNISRLAVYRYVRENS